MWQSWTYIIVDHRQSMVAASNIDQILQETVLCENCGLKLASSISYETWGTVYDQ